MDTPTIVLLRAVKGSLDTNLSPVSVIIPNTMRVPPPMTGAGSGYQRAEFRYDAKGEHNCAGNGDDTAAHYLVHGHNAHVLAEGRNHRNAENGAYQGGDSGCSHASCQFLAAGFPVKTSYRGACDISHGLHDIDNGIKRIGRTMDRSKDGIP